MARIDGRQPNEMRELEILPDHFRKNDCLISYGATKVLCYASIEDRIPGWLSGSGCGWLTAEYNMMPSAGDPRQNRERMYAGGRTQEIQRLIGRSLRAAVKLSSLPPLTVRIDCDVILADGGTRTASVTGAMVALANLVSSESHRFRTQPLKCLTAAVSVGIVEGQPVLDLNYVEDRDAEVDANVVGLSTGGFAEFQATNEHGTFNREQLNEMLDLAEASLEMIYQRQREHIALKEI